MTTYDASRISIIVPTFNETKVLSNLLCDLHSAAQQGAQVIFADSGSTDGTLEMIDSSFCVVPCGRGRGRALNEGAARAAGDVLLFLHADSVLPQEFLQQVCAVMADHRAGCFGIQFPRRNPVLKLCQVLSNLRVSVRGLAYGDQGIFVRREVFDQLGGFKDLPFMEDLDFSLRMRQAGIRPRLTASRIETSDRRFGDTTADHIRVWSQMVSLRKRFMSGVNVEHLAAEYRDVR